MRYPIGEFTPPTVITAAQIQIWIQEIEALPEQITLAVAGLDDQALERTYRPGSWTIRQVVHHLPDSHMNSYIRFKWTLTEEASLIKPYFEDRWANLPDYQASIDVSLNLLHALHERWAVLLHSLSEADLSKAFTHPEDGKTYPLNEVIGLYAWHGKHHLAHIELAKQGG